MGLCIGGQRSSWQRERRRWQLALFVLAMAAAVTTVTSGAASAVAPASYVNPLRAAQGLVGERIDEGVDYVAAGGSPVYALGTGIVTEVYNSGWPNGVFLVYQLTSGPAQGLYVYVAEDVTPSVSVGQQVTSGTVLARFEAGADGGYDIEMGWADPCSCGQALAATYGQYPVDGDATAFGRDFNDLVASLGAPVGSIQGRETGTLPAGWPVWTAAKAVQHVFFAGANGHVFESYFRPTRWRGGQDMCTSHGWGCTPSSAASVAVNPATDEQYVFWRGPHGDINEAYHQSGTWHGPINMCTKKNWGCAAADAPDVAVADDGSQYVVYTGANGHHYTAFHQSGAWHGALDMCATYGWECTPSSAPSIAVNPATDQQYVFWRGPHGDINEAYHQSGAWHGPINMCASQGWGCLVASVAPSVAVSASMTPPPAQAVATPATSPPRGSTRSRPAPRSPRTPSPKPSATSSSPSPKPSTSSSPPRTPSPKPSPTSTSASPTPSTSSPPRTPSPTPSPTSTPASPTSPAKSTSSSTQASTRTSSSAAPRS